MLHAFACVLLAVAPAPLEDEVAFLAAVEKVELRINDKVYPRIERDAAGQVARLRLDQMQLAPADYKHLGRITTLRYLSLRSVNATSDDLAHLCGLPSLEYLVLSDTEVTDKAIVYIAQLPALKTLCMGNVKIAPESVAVLKEHCPRLTLGYSQRK